jgi:hypothetical protein
VEAQSLMDCLAAAGGQATLSGTRVVFRAPKGAVPAELRQALDERRAEIAALLTRAADDQVYAAVAAAPGIDLTGLYQGLDPMPLAELRAALRRLVETGRVAGANEPLPGLEKHTVYSARREP